MPLITLKAGDDGVSGEESFNRESSPIEIIPDGTTATVIVTDVKHVKKPWTDDHGQEIWNYEFTFKILNDSAGGRYVNQRLWADVWDEFSDDKRCKLRFWAQELLATPLDVGFQLDTDHLIDKLAAVSIGIRTWDKSDGTTGTKNVVKWLSRVKDGEEVAEATPRETDTTKPLLAYAQGEEPF